MATHLSTLAWKITWTEKPCNPQGGKRQTQLSDFTFTFFSVIFRFFSLFCMYGCCSVTQSCVVTPWTEACQVSLSFTISVSFLKLRSIELVMPSKHLIMLCHSLLLLLLSFPASGYLYVYLIILYIYRCCGCLVSKLCSTLCDP